MPAAHVNQSVIEVVDTVGSLTLRAGRPPTDLELRQVTEKIHLARNLTWGRAILALTNKQIGDGCSVPQGTTEEYYGEVLLQIVTNMSLVQSALSRACISTHNPGNSVAVIGSSSNDGTQSLKNLMSGVAEKSLVLLEECSNSRVRTMKYVDHCTEWPEFYKALRDRFDRKNTPSVLGSSEHDKVRKKIEKKQNQAKALARVLSALIVSIPEKTERMEEIAYEVNKILSSEELQLEYSSVSV